MNKLIPNWLAKLSLIKSLKNFLRPEATSCRNYHYYSENGGQFIFLLFFTDLTELDTRSQSEGKQNMEKSILIGTNRSQIELKTKKNVIMISILDWLIHRCKIKFSCLSS